MNTWIVVPCYNEAGRLDTAAIESLVTAADLGVILVDDSSSDHTWAVFEGLKVQLREKVEMIRMARNVGKAEAVRQGMHHAVDLGARMTGYLDADFATPAQEMLRMVRAMDRQQFKVMFGARWLHLGARIERSPFRHYAGRVFATLASIILAMPVYDTQCGAKLFLVTDTLRAAINQPFHSRWAFDVELLGRLRAGVADTHGYDLEDFAELPLNTWIDVKGSKIGVFDMVRATLDLLIIARALKVLRDE